MAPSNSKTTGRGAKAPRSSFRGPEKAPAKPVKPRPAKAEPTTAAAGKAASKARAATQAKLLAARRPRTPAPPTAPAAPSPLAPGLTLPLTEVLGTVTCPSGRLAVFDIGLAGFLPREALEPALIVVDVPADRPLRVIGTRVGTGRLADRWDHLAVELGVGEVGEVLTHTRLGRAGVDLGRIALIDHAAFDHWQAEDSLDGRADVVFWGKDELILARTLTAAQLPEGHGWTDLTVEQAEGRLLEAQRRQATNKWRLTLEFRPHSHQFHALAAVRADPRGAGALTIAGSQMLLIATSWGNGVFPVELARGADDAPVQLRIQLATPEGVLAATRARLQ